VVAKTPETSDASTLNVFPALNVPVVVNGIETVPVLQTAELTAPGVIVLVPQLITVTFLHPAIKPGGMQRLEPVGVTNSAKALLAVNAVGVYKLEIALGTAVQLADTASPASGQVVAIDALYHW